MGLCGPGRTAIAVDHAKGDAILVGRGRIHLHRNQHERQAKIAGPKGNGSHSGYSRYTTEQRAIWAFGGPPQLSAQLTTPFLPILPHAVYSRYASSEAAIVEAKMQIDRLLAI